MTLDTDPKSQTKNMVEEVEHTIGLQIFYRTTNNRWNRSTESFDALFQTHSKDGTLCSRYIGDRRASFAFGVFLFLLVEISR
jgi:hypothetical protein